MAVSLGSDPGRTTESAHNEIQLRHTSLQAYLSLENDPDGLKTAIHRRSQGPKPELVIERRGDVDAAVDGGARKSQATGGSFRTPWLRSRRRDFSIFTATWSSPFETMAASHGARSTWAQARAAT